eukprot:jgi/Picsp_1/4528/NSC_06749-R1_predicted protein [Ostreococcus lucimarinus CCE9901]
MVQTPWGAAADVTPAPRTPNQPNSVGFTVYHHIFHERGELYPIVVDRTTGDDSIQPGIYFMQKDLMNAFKSILHQRLYPNDLSNLLGRRESVTKFNLTKRQLEVDVDWRAGDCAHEDAEVELLSRFKAFMFHKCARGAMEPHHPANEIVVNDEFKFVYVEVRKSGSSSIRKILNEYFNSSFNGCPNSIPRNDSCLVIGGRCSTLCLTEDHVEQYYFFSFVRNPEDRFYSGYKEAFNQRFSKRGIQLENQTHINEVLEKIIVSHYHSDQHLASVTATA